MSNEYLTLKKLQEITGFSKSYIYKLTSSRAIGFFKPFGKKVYFSKAEIDEKFKTNRISSKSEILEATKSTKGGNYGN
jgi:excisionase family DNA binding protein